VDQLFYDAPLLLHARRRQCAAFHGIEHAQKMLALAKYNLGGPNGFSFRRISHQI
jgi:hypothetical protein